MGAKSILVVAGVAIATLLYLVYLGATYEPPQGTTTVVVPAPASQPIRSEPERPSQVQRTPVTVVPEPEELVEVTESAEPEESVAVIEPEPEVLEEQVEEPVEAEVVQLPALGASDSFISQRLQQLSDGATLLSYLVDQQMVRRFVVLVDNISQGNLPQTNLPYRDVEGDFAVRTIDDNLFELDEAGFRRFDRVVNAIIAIDTDQAMMLYRLTSPLFQQAYAELGYGEVSFDTTLRRAIRNVLATDDIQGPLQLVKPSVMYLYADSDIEAMSDIQKQMIRIGPDNREKVKAKLRQVLQQL
jgi:hypothetical protein